MMKSDTARDLPAPAAPSEAGPPMIVAGGHDLYSLDPARGRCGRLHSSRLCASRWAIGIGCVEVGAGIPWKGLCCS